MILTTRDGRKLTYRRMGNGPVLVCHPGGPGFSSTEFGDLAALWEKYTLILLNPRGTGGSDRPKDARAYQLDDYVDDVEALREHLGLERILLLGYSHGGIVAQAYAAKHPGRVRKLVLACTLARLSPEQDAAMHAGMDKRSGEPWFADAALEDEQAGNFTDGEITDLMFRELPLYFARFGPAEAGYLDTLRNDPFNADALRVFNEEAPSMDLRERHALITSPTLVITGSEDFICGPVCADEIAAGIAGSRKVIVGDAGHMIFVEQPEAFYSEVSDFLESSQ